ncbi:MAG: DUF4112 domain-containing protein [Gemmatimonadaceae bacterium]|nr:DUF4112 domain-containing protein [Gemmatimonadaceae bacterium]
MSVATSPLHAGDAAARATSSLARARTLARLLDSAARVPGTNVRFGLDAILGLVPGLGDIAGAAFSAHLVLLAARLGAPRATLVRMVANVAIDVVGGAVPVLGDLFDVTWRANTRNVALLDEHLALPSATVGDGNRASRLAVAGAIAGLALLAAGAVFLTIVLIRFVADAVR